MYLFSVFFRRNSAKSETFGDTATGDGTLEERVSDFLLFLCCPACLLPARQRVYASSSYPITVTNLRFGPGRQDGYAEQDGEPSNRSLGSIADRMRSLQNAGLKVQTTKRLSRDLSVASPATATTMSPPPVDWKERTISSSSSITRSSSHMSSPTLTQSQSFSQPHSQSQQQPSVSSHPTGSSVHSMSSSLGPPSPSIISTDSPRFATLSEFNQAFPSIDELDEGLPSLPPVPTNMPGSSSNVPPISPSVIKRFPSLPLDLDPGPRPASTPIPPSMAINGLQHSRPASPTSTARSMRSPLSPGIPLKPIGLTFTGSSSSARASPLNTGEGSSPGNVSGSRTPVSIPVTSAIHPKSLRDYLGRSNEVRVLLLDIRTRDEFEKGHIKSDAVVCLEPHVLQRDGYETYLIYASIQFIY